MKKRIVCLLTAAVLLLVSAVPALALGQTDPRVDIPVGYNANDYMKALAFMETCDENGVRNGEKIVAFFSGHYLPGDPESWSYFYYDHENAILYIYGIFWTDGTDRRVSSLWLYDMDLTGDLDLSGMTQLSEVYCDYNKLGSIKAAGCTSLRAMTCKNCGLAELNISGCVGLDLFDCSNNSLSSLDASDCVSATDIECADNKISSIDVSGCEALQWLNCSNNVLTELDITHNAELDHLCCLGNKLNELDLSGNPGLPFDMIRAEGAGHISYSNYSCFDASGYWINMNAAVAEPAAEGGFLGWYSESGEFISANPELSPNASSGTRIVARFEGYEILPGDVNNDGTVDAADALLILRYAVGLAELPSYAFDSCDVNHDGLIDAADALLILRYALGVIDSF